MERNTLLDIYFDDNYGKLYEKTENGVARVFLFEHEFGVIKHQFIEREILISFTSTDEKYYDLVTPYGYGGPVILECTGNRERLIKDFEIEFKAYCKEHHIVSEFVRFHPIFNNAMDFKDMYETIWDRQTVGTDLKNYKIEEEFSKSAKKNIKRSLNNGVTFRVTENPSEIDKFIEIYNATMERNDASEYYYFGRKYFDTCLRYYGPNILLVEAIYEKKVIAAGFYFRYGSIIQAHLSGTLTEYLYLSPTYIIKYATALWAVEHGVSYIHYGGGTDSTEENSLYQFKSRFGKHTRFDFYVGKRVWNEDIYERLCKIKGTEENTRFFPAYRGE